jgi:hypothetical protein
MFYLNLNAGQLRRISFGDAPPEAFAAAVPSGGLPPLTVRFTADGSGDSKNRALNIVWDFGDGSPTSTDPNPWHTYTTVGDFTAKLSVTAGGTVVTDSVAISTRAPTPKVSITAPALGSKYPPGSDVTFVADLSENTAPMTFAWDLWLGTFFFCASFGHATDPGAQSIRRTTTHRQPFQRPRRKSGSSRASP